MGRGVNRKERKERSDKKRDIKPTVTIELKDTIYRLALITNNPVMHVAEEICKYGIRDGEILEYLSENFRKSIRIGNTIYRGNENNPHIRRYITSAPTSRVSIRFYKREYDEIHALSYAMECTVSRACALILDATVRNGDFINEFVRKYLEDNIDGERMKELRKILKYVNANNPYNEEYSWGVLLSHMMEEVKYSAEKVSETVSEFIVNTWNDK